MALTAEKKQVLVQTHRRGDSDTGSPEVQVSILTYRINELTGHVRAHRHDYASRRGLLKMVSKRNRLLRYLAREDRSRYQELIGRLGLRK
ncbi:MAG: 30S ribosomal protein S15 [Pirellulaceae bacterium]|nr:30S ribosomal protein S15 [Pirellulaceae bacterium]